jgi:pimeloyl-ACP methyl ester carboxylesterase
MVLSGRLPPAAMFPAGRPELRIRYLDLASGLRVRTVETGDISAPLVLLVPGWGCSTYVFRENLVPLAGAGYHVVAVDLKGHGLSDKPTAAGEYRLESMRLHLTQIIEALGEPAIICGLSMGAALSAHVADSSPERVRGLVMVSPVGFSGVRGLTAVRVATASPITPLLPKIADRKVIELLLNLVNGKLRSITPRDVDEFWAPTQFLEFTLAMRHLLHKFTWRAPFPALTVPALLISGTRDRFVSREALASCCMTLPGMRHIEVEDAGHVVYDEAAPIINRELLEFFEKLI